MTAEEKQAKPSGAPVEGIGAPLAGVRVVDLSRVLAGPYCAQLLADMGAQVIKVERPEGDESRRWPPLWEGNDVSSNFGSVNRGKLGMTLDLKSDGAPEMLRRLVEWGDVLIHNFLPETAARLGIDYERMHAINPRLVFCSLTGYGERGPLRQLSVPRRHRPTTRQSHALRGSWTPHRRAHYAATDDATPSGRSDGDAIGSPHCPRRRPPWHARCEAG